MTGSTDMSGAHLCELVAIHMNTVIFVAVQQPLSSMSVAEVNLGYDQDQR